MQTQSSEVAQQIKDEQDNEYEAEAAAAADMPPVSIAATAEENNKNDNKEDEHHGKIRYGGCFFTEEEGNGVSFSVDEDKDEVTVSVGFDGA